jgi:hypothetical protein
VKKENEHHFSWKLGSRTSWKRAEEDEEDEEGKDIENE